MEIGKIPNSVLQRIVIDKLKPKRKEILLRPKIGEDCCAIDLDGFACVLTGDPITASDRDAGRLAVHVSCNDLASSGAEPVGMLITLLLPPSASEQELEEVMDQIAATAEQLNVDIIGGHTEVTASVNRIVISGTAVGKAHKDHLVSTAGAKPGDGIVLTKHAGLEGAAIIASDKGRELQGKMDARLLDEARSHFDSISVVNEGRIAAGFGVSAMHDVTEGGVLGALWEMCEASGTGAVVEAEKIPMMASTQQICRYFGLDPFKLISSGCMLIACSRSDKLVEELNKEGISAAIIGRMTSSGERILMKDGFPVPITQPEADELYKVI